MIATDTVLETGSLDLPVGGGGGGGGGYFSTPILTPPPPPNVANNAKLIWNYGRELIIE